MAEQKTINEKEIFERNKETLKFMLSNKGFVFADYTMLSAVQCIEYTRKYDDYTITIALHTDNTLKLMICNNTTKNLIISRRLKIEGSSEASFIVAITKLYNFIISFKNIFTEEQKEK